MKTLKQIIHILGGRVARNIYMWGFLIWLRLDYFDFKYTFQEMTFCLLLMSILALLLYFNNLILVPIFFVRKKRFLLYFPLAFASIVAVSFFSAFVFNTIQQLFPHLNVNKISWVPLPEINLRLKLLVIVHVEFFTILIIIFTLCWYTIDRQRKQTELINVRKKQTETELAFLKGQLNPHFLFNTLNNLYGLALKKADNTSEAILKLSLILRYLLYKSDAALVSFDEEKEIMHAYIDLELLRLSSTNNISFFIAADKPYSVPPLLWLPVLENVFKHGTRYISDVLSVEYRCAIENNVMNIYSRNTFKPDNKHMDKSVGGIGLTNLRKRLDLLYAGKHQINMNQAGDIYTVDIKINLA